MNVLVDTNVWLDIVQDRQPFFEDSACALSLLEKPEHSAYLSATSVTTLFYLLAKHTGNEVARTHIARILGRYEVASVDGPVLREASASEFSDFEDAVIHEAALRAKLDAIVTRNAGDFSSANLAVYTPAEFVAALTA